MEKFISSVLTIGYQNQQGFIVYIETVTRRGLFQFDIIGLANKTISESKQRILSAIDYSETQKKQYLHKKITTLLSPADIKKEGSHFDLPIAVSYLIASGSSTNKNDQEIITMYKELFSSVAILGELTLTGSILPVKHISTLIRVGIDKGIYSYIIPKDNIREINHVENVNIWAVSHISEILQLLNRVKNTRVRGDSQKIFDGTLIKVTNFGKGETGDKENSEALEECSKEEGKNKTFLIDSILGNETLKRAIEVSLAGKHHILIVGEPGSGKSLIAKSARELIPHINRNKLNIFQIEYKDGSEHQKINMETNLSKQSNVISNERLRPFREPHHTSSYSDIIGNRILPGEITLAHGGILFLDELSEFNKRVLEGLRQPLENKYIQKNQQSLIETDFILVACMNPCDCGYYQSKSRRCICARNQIEKFKRKINSPLFQRFDLYINSVEYSAEFKKDVEDRKGVLRSVNITDRKNLITHRYSRQAIYENILRVRKLQQMREEQHVLNSNNSYSLSEKRNILLELDLQNLEGLNTTVRSILHEITSRFSLSKREIMSLLRVTRTIADIEASESISEKHVLEALSLRNKRS